jgi:type II secretory pathway predicted ATPase ExeA
MAPLLDDDRRVRTRLEAWMAATGATDLDVAEHTGYKRATINLYRNGRYCEHKGNEADNSVALRAALTSMMDAEPVSAEIAQGGVTYDTETYRKVRRAFHRALDQGWAYIIDGPPGTQKSYTVQALRDEVRRADAAMNGHGRRVLYVCCRPQMSRRDLLIEICLEAGIPARGDIGQMVRKIRHAMEGRRALLIVDEAQWMDVVLLDTLRIELLDRKPYIGIIFAGSHDIQERINDPKMEQWRRRIQRTLELEGLQETEAREIVVRELGPLDEERIRKLIEHSRARDYRKRGSTYLSAGNLFYAIKQIQLARGEKEPAGEQQ